MGSLKLGQGQAAHDGEREGGVLLSLRKLQRKTYVHGATAGVAGRAFSELTCLQPGSPGAAPGTCPGAGFAAAPQDCTSVHLTQKERKG